MSNIQDGSGNSPIDVQDDSLFAPLKINQLEVDGRVFKTATTETWATEDGYISDEYMRFYEPFAHAKTPLIITGNMYVGQSGKPTYRTPGIEHDDKIPGLKKFTDMVHSNGSKVVAQINHVGRQTNPKAVGNKVALAPSAVREMTSFNMPRAMTLAEIERTIEEFALASKRAKEAGFDGVQIHVSHGYLLCQFLTPRTNRREDEYGGSFEKRLRFSREVIRAARMRVGPDYPILIKLNGSDMLMVKGGLETPELIEIAKALVAEGVDAIEVSCAHYESGFPNMRGRFDNFIKVQMQEGQGIFLPKWRRVLMSMFNKPIGNYANSHWPTQEGFNLDFARQFKAELSVPIITVGGYNTPNAMRDALNSGAADAISVARAMIADPFFYQHLREGKSGPHCDYCNQCVARGGGKGLDCYNPALPTKRKEMLKAAGF